MGHHNGHHPEIQVLGPDEATGIWYLADHMWILEPRFQTSGTALYWDRYAKTDGRWQIRETRYRRIYETTHVLPPMEPGLHTIRIGLFTNDHRAYAADGVPVERTIVFQAPAADVAPPPGPAARAEVRIENGEAAPRSARVTQGELVGIEWSSDAAHDLHLHGYDIEMHVEPGVAAAVYLVVHASGRFPVAMHGGAGGHGHSTLFSLEVYPR